MKNLTLALLAVLWPSAAVLAAEPGANCKANDILSKYYDLAKDAKAKADYGRVHAYFHPMEFELIFKDHLYNISADDKTYFTAKPAPKSTAPNFQRSHVAAAEQAFAKPGDDGLARTKKLADAVRGKLVKEATDAKAKEVAAADAAAFSPEEEQFLTCRMNLTGQRPAFDQKRQAATGDQAKAFTRYWRAFMAFELAVYTDQAKLPATAPVDYKAAYSGEHGMLARTAAAVADDKPAFRQKMFQLAGISDTAPQAPTEPAAKSDFPEKPLPDMLSAAESKHMSEKDQKDYLTKWVGLKSNPNWKQGDKDDGSKEAYTGLMRFGLNNLSDDAYSHFGASSSTVKAKIEAQPFGSQERMDVADSYRQTAQKIMEHGANRPPAFANDQALAKYLAEHPEKRDCIWTNNCNTGTLPGPAPNLASGNGGKKDKDNAATSNDGQPENTQADRNKNDTSKSVPAPDRVEAKKDEGGGWKKDLKAIGNGVRAGMYLALLGAFLGGPGAALLFGMAGLVGGYGLTKLNGMMGD